MNNKFCFVVLHYKTLDDTKKCVDSILSRYSNKNTRIVIVDNFSNDGSGEKLINLYNEIESVKILNNSSNLGFSRGNNVGFLYAKNIFKSDFIILLNSDTYIIQDDFCEVISKEYLKSNFAVLGPKIYTPYANSCCCNPMRKQHLTKREVGKYILKFKFYTLLNYFNLDLIYINLKLKIKKIGLYSNRKTDFEDYDKRMTDVQLHGCCLIFSPIYINKYDGLNERTFLYMEEDLLFIEMHKKELLTVYNPNLKIFHSEEVTSSIINKKPKEKRKQKYINIIKSSYIVKEALDNKN